MFDLSFDNSSDAETWWYCHLIPTLNKYSIIQPHHEFIKSELSAMVLVSNLFINTYLWKGIKWHCELLLRIKGKIPYLFEAGT